MMDADRMQQRISHRVHAIIFSVGVAALFGTLFVFYRLRETLGVLERQPVLFVFVPSAIAFGFGLRFLLYRVAAVRQATAEAAMASDSRAPILYLRSFRRDKNRFASLLKWLIYLPAFMIRAFIYLPTYEQQLSIIASRAGPLIALGDPSGEQHVGAARFEAKTDATWRALVDELSARAQLIILRSDDTNNLLWEISNIVERDQLEKLVLYVQFEGGKNSAVRELMMRRFFKSLGKVLGVSVPRNMHAEGYFTIDSDRNLTRRAELTQILRARGVKVEESTRRVLGKAIWPFARHHGNRVSAGWRTWMLGHLLLWLITVPLAGLIGWGVSSYVTHASYGHNFSTGLGELKNARLSMALLFWPAGMAASLLCGKVSSMLSAYGNKIFIALGVVMALTIKLVATQMEWCILERDNLATCTAFSVDAFAVSSGMLAFLGDSVPLILLTVGPYCALLGYLTWIAGLSRAEAGITPPESEY